MDFLDGQVDPTGNDRQDAEHDDSEVHLEREPEDGQEDHCGGVRDDVLLEVEDFPKHGVGCCIHPHVQAQNHSQHGRERHGWDES